MKSISTITILYLTAACYLLAEVSANCNELENLVNKERRRGGLSPLHCDANMRWVADRHLDDEEEAASSGLKFPSKCNSHSWLVKYPCCYTSDHSNSECMWDKPYQLSGWDKRNGFEISAWHSNSMNAARAIQQWKGSSGHYDLIMTRGIWTELLTVGCAYRKNSAHCWFANEKY